MPTTYSRCSSEVGLAVVTSASLVTVLVVVSLVAVIHIDDSISNNEGASREVSNFSSEMGAKTLNSMFNCGLVNQRHEKIADGLK